MIMLLNRSRVALARGGYGEYHCNFKCDFNLSMQIYQFILSVIYLIKEMYFFDCSYADDFVLVLITFYKCLRTLYLIFLVIYFVAWRLKNHVL